MLRKTKKNNLIYLDLSINLFPRSRHRIVVKDPKIKKIFLFSKNYASRRRKSKIDPSRRNRAITAE